MPHQLVVLMSLAGNHEEVVSFGALVGGPNRRRAVRLDARLAFHGTKARFNFADDGKGVLCPGIVLGDPATIRKFLRNRRHEGPLSPVTVSSTTENEVQAAFAELAAGSQ